MDKLLWDEKRLFHYWAHAASLVPTNDYPIHQVMMRRYPSMSSVYHTRLVDFIEHNQTLRRHILLQLRRKGPLRTSDFQDLAVKSYKSGGWNTDRNVDRMLDYLWTKGKVMIAGRAGLQRVWDLSERWFPEWTPKETLTIQESTRRATERTIKALGVATERQIKAYFTRGRYKDLSKVLGQLRRKGMVVGARVPELVGTWYVHSDDIAALERLQAGGWEPRTTLLSPFDNLIADRRRTKDVWDFDFTIEIYVPKDKRRFGYYVLPVLMGDRLVGRIDPAMDRKTGVLTIKGIWAERDAPDDTSTGHAIATAVEGLAKFLGASDIKYPRKISEGWKPAFS